MAQPLEEDSAPWAPDPIRQRLRNYTVEDVLALPDDAPRVELADGKLLPMTPPRFIHQQICFLLCLWLHNNAPRNLVATQGLGVLIDGRNTFEPDVLLLNRTAAPDGHFYHPRDVPLVVEVLSPSTRRRDRFDKLSGYAEAGIPNYWIIEPDPVHVFAYRLTAAGDYTLVTDSDKELFIDEPFPIQLPIDKITP